MSMQTILLYLYTIIDGKPTDDICVHGAPNTSFLKEHGLTVDSPPVDFINAFIPKMNRKKNISATKRRTGCLSRLCDYVTV